MTSKLTGTFFSRIGKLNKKLNIFTFLHSYKWPIKISIQILHYYVCVLHCIYNYTIHSIQFYVQNTNGMIGK